MHFFRSYLAMLLTSLSLAVAASDSSPYFTTTPFPNQRLFIENINLSARDFFTAYMSEEEHERRYAELYLLGVLDTTEGTSWCSYKKFKTTTIQERIYEDLKALNDSKLKERASKVITEILNTRWPCKDADQ